MRCPTCPDTVLVMSSREGIEIDHCPQCRGVWLDRGELDKIIERAAPSVVGTSGGQRAEDRTRDDRPRYEERPRYDDRDDRSRSHDYKKKKKGGFLEDLFDFG